MVIKERLIVLLDACVLYPVTIANILLELAWRDTYSAKWTKEIDREWSQSLIRDRPEINPQKLQYRLKKMHQAIPDWEIKKSSYQKFISSLQLPDPNDRHVLAAAIAAQVDIIVTKNIKDFPSKILEKFGIKTLHPDDFVMFLISLEPLKSLEIIKSLRERNINPKINKIEFVDSLKKVGLPKTANYLQKFIVRI